MNALDLRRWAKETLIEAVDEALLEQFSDTVNGSPGLEKQLALLHQRNRIARTLGAGVKKLSAFPARRA